MTEVEKELNRRADIIIRQEKRIEELEQKSRNVWDENVRLVVNLRHEIESLKKENAELKDNFKIAKDNEYEYSSLLTKAKEIIKELYEGLDKLYLSGLSDKQIAFVEQLQDKTEQFLEENSISEHIQRATHNYVG